MRMPYSRREWLQVSGAGVLSASLLRGRPAPPAHDGVVVASGNGLKTVEAAWNAVKQGARPVRAAVDAVGIVEADPNDTSVGYGGLPNERGVVQLDSACMDGPTHNAGGVASLENIMHPAQVAHVVMEQTDHVLLVGPGAKEFALSYGFKEENLLTDSTREKWVRWRARRSADDDYLWPLDSGAGSEDRPWGTIHCSVLSPGGDLGCCTTTSGLAWKIPGRVGDSPLIGCGLYCDNEVGSAGATGRGEAAIHAGGSWLVVERMRAGDTAEQACLYAMKRVSDQARKQRAWQPRMWNDDKNRPNFGLTFYAVRKDGDFGAAVMHSREGKGRFAVCTADGARKEDCAALYAS